MARGSIVLLVLVPLLAGCLGDDDAPTPTVPEPSQADEAPTGPAASPAPGAPRPAPSSPGPAPVPTSANPNLRIEEFPLPVDVSKPMALRVPGGGTALLTVQSEGIWRVEGSTSAASWFALMHPREGMTPPSGTCSDVADGLRFAAPAVNLYLDWQSIPAGEYVFYVHNPNGTELILRFHGAPANVAENLTGVHWRNHTATYFDHEVPAGSNASPYSVAFTHEIATTKSALVFTRFGTEAQFTIGGGNMTSTLSTNDGTTCDGRAFDVPLDEPRNTNVVLRAAAWVAPGQGTITWGQTFDAAAALNIRHQSEAAVIQYDGPAIYRPFWVP